MAFHIMLARPEGLPAIAQQAARGERPRHALAMLAEQLGATLHEPDLQARAGPFDTLRSKLAGPPALWPYARALAQRLGPDDCVFCPGEGPGLHMAAMCGQRARPPKLAVFVHNLDRPRGRVALKLWRAARTVDLFLACSPVQVDFLRRYLGLPAERVVFVEDHTDVGFFKPGPVSPTKTRPLVVSVGLEQRDYRTLAAATADMDIDVRVSGFSKDASVIAETFPEVMPANMTRQFYAWTDLAQLYRDADVVVVTARENKYAAGVQSLMEGMACGRPVIATATQGLSSYLDPSCVVAVEPGNAEAMRRAIEAALADPATGAARGAQARSLALQRHDIDRYVGDIATQLRGLMAVPARA